MTNIFKLYRLVRGVQGLLIFTLLLNVGAALVGVIRPFFFKQILDSVVEVTGDATHSYSEIISPLAALLVLSLVIAAISYVTTINSDRLFFTILRNLRKRIFSKLFELSPDYFETHKVGELSQRLSEGAFRFGNLVEDVVNSSLVQVVTLFLSLGVLWYVSPAAGLVMTLVVPLTIWVRLRRRKDDRANRREAAIYNEQASGQMAESISHNTTVRSFNQEQQMEATYGDYVDRHADKRMQITKRVAVLSLVEQLLTNFALVASIGIVAVLAIRGSSTPGDILLVSLYLQQIIGSIRPIGRFLTMVDEVETSSSLVMEVLESGDVVPDTPGATPLEGFRSLQFKNVTFSYPGKRTKVLKNVSFTVKKGETLALVGPSGVGKSTITKLIMRFYDVTSGAILINGRDIRGYTQESVRRVMAMVMQDVALFNDTIEANLAFANPEAKPKQVQEAAKRAHAQEFIGALPEGYKTLVGERGIKLSGGQKQRVAIARAILKDPELIILDEATSALDSESEQFVKAGLKELLADRTAVVIAHRLSTVMSATKIIVLQGGRVVEQGTHAQLLKKGGLYARLFKLQSI